MGLTERLECQGVLVGSLQAMAGWRELGRVSEFFPKNILDIWVEFRYIVRVLTGLLWRLTCSGDVVCLLGFGL